MLHERTRPENGVALTAGGAMRAEDDRRVRQKQTNPSARFLSPFWGTNLKIFVADGRVAALSRSSLGTELLERAQSHARIARPVGRASASWGEA